MHISLLKNLLLMVLITLVPQLSVAEVPFPLAVTNTPPAVNFENCLFKNPSCRLEWLSPAQKQALQAEQTRQNFYYCSHNLPQCKRPASAQTLAQQRQLQAQRLANQRRYQAQQARSVAARVYRAPTVYRARPPPVQRFVPNKPVMRPPAIRANTVVARSIARANPRVAQSAQQTPRHSYSAPAKPIDAKSGQVSPAVEYVRGYTRKNGTKVQGYYRTKRDHTITNNFSYYANVNPYTGRRGTVYPENFTSSRGTYVSGYYRKDGTYVRSHYRRKRR